MIPSDAVLDALEVAGVAEARLHDDIRKAHCDHHNSGSATHECVGTTIISPKGTFLSCKLCGKCALDEKVKNARDAHNHLHKLTSSLSRAHLRVINAVDELDAVVDKERNGYRT